MGELLVSGRVYLISQQSELYSYIYRIIQLHIYLACSNTMTFVHIASIVLFVDNEKTLPSLP